MTQIIPAARNLRPPTETTTPWAGGKKFDLVRILGLLSNAIEEESGRQNLLAVQALGKKLEELVDQQRITRFAVHGWRGDELTADVYMRDDLYTRRRRMALQRELGSSVAELGYYVDATILADITDGEPA